MKKCKLFYCPIIKTGDAEIRGLENLDEEVKNHITPLIELTRSRSTKKLPRGDIFRRIKRLKQAYGERRFILDLTSIPELTNMQIEDLLKSEGNYQNWIDFLIDLKEELPLLIPTILVTDDVDDLSEINGRLQREAKELNKSFDWITYRFEIQDEEYESDLDIIKTEIDLAHKLICVIDCNFISQQKASIYSNTIENTIKKLINLGVHNIIVAGTSFPQNPTEFGEEKYGEYKLEEVLTFEKVHKDINRDFNKKINLIYGDYASVNPNRNDQRGGSPWIPRIDIPMSQNLFYFRYRRNKDIEETYDQAYKKVARQIVRDDRYKKIRKKLNSCWGVQQIEMAANNSPPGLSPSFWISVRMNIHITLQLSRILSRINL